MKSKTVIKKIYTMTLAFFLISVLLGVTSIAAQQSEPVLEIYEVKSGLGQVILTVKNTGDLAADQLVMSIIVTGGIAGRIDITKICAGCGGCSNSLQPNETKTESTAEEAIIFGFGVISITVSAEASNAQTVEQTLSGFVIGPIILISS